jgi:HEAT repeat protein
MNFDHSYTVNPSRFLTSGLLAVVFLLCGPNLPAADTKGLSAEQRAEKVRADLKSSDVEARRAAIKSLSHSDISRTLLPEIQAALQDTDGEVRSWAATVAGPEGAAALPLVPQLIVQLNNDTAKEARETAARALGRIGRAAPEERRAVPALEVASRKDADSVTRVVALGALAMMDANNTALVTEISVYLRHEDPLTRMKAAHSLGQLGERAKASAPDIAKALEQATEPHQRGYLARALGQAGDPAWLQTLYAELAKETSPEASGEMRGAIQRLGGKPPAKNK